MSKLHPGVRGRRIAAKRRLRELMMIAKGVVSTDHPVMAHIIPIRRCNLACKYCNEYDDYSKPVALDIMKSRIDHLARLGTNIVTLSGGEPLLHPELDEIIAHMRTYPIIVGMITNGYLLTADRIQRLNRAGLDHLQISIDNVMPDDVSKKSLKVLDKKLQLLAEHADFHVNINSVVGGGTRNPHDALVIGRRAVQLGFTSTIGIIHDGDGQLQPLSDEEREVFLKMKNLEKKNYSRFNQFQDNIAYGQAQQLAMPRRRSLSVHLRRRAGALLLAATRVSGSSAGSLLGGGHPPRISHRKELRSALHGFVRAPGFVYGLLARAADAAGAAIGRRSGTTGTDRVASFRAVRRCGGAHRLRSVVVIFDAIIILPSDCSHTSGRVAQLAEQLTLNQ